MMSGRIEESLRSASKANKQRSFDYTQDLIDEKLREVETIDQMRSLGASIKEMLTEAPHVPLEQLSGMDVWMFARLKELVAEMKARVGFKNLRLDPAQRTAELLVPEMRLDLGDQCIPAFGVGVCHRAGMGQHGGRVLDPPCNPNMRRHEARSPSKPGFRNATGPTRNIHCDLPRGACGPGIQRRDSITRQAKRGPSQAPEGKRRPLLTLGPDLRAVRCGGRVPPLGSAQGVFCHEDLSRLIQPQVSQATATSQLRPNEKGARRRPVPSCRLP